MSCLREGQSIVPRNVDEFGGITSAGLVECGQTGGFVSEKRKTMRISVRDAKRRSHHLPKRKTRITLLMLHLLFHWQLHHLGAHVEHCINLRLDAMILQAVS